jgi:metal-responsive CopG/Arc/MetJ family transcriptional regulator
VLFQLDDVLLADLDRIARELSLSRSELVRRALGVYVTSRDELEEDRRTIEAYRRIPEDPTDDELYLRLASEAFSEGEAW